ncbi:uncharacterized protein PAC_06112 [Phialocephala subalpina]|uniref:F-box domain-containing protein n=1 Tax=Phialocephala subalpina TaxID=576137 RepID=A0A1L7WTW7_9HELO|nr:uncharacterized protein PAC_06112 [Phialocephala subalpina]
MPPHPTSPDLGTLSTLPLELRERVYGLVLDFNEPPPEIEINPNLDEPPYDPYSHAPGCTCHSSNTKAKPEHKLSLLLVSKVIHNESRLVLFRVNEWKIEVDDDSEGMMKKNEPNISIMGKPGWSMQFAHAFGGRGNVFSPLQTAALDRDNIWSELRFVHVSVGSGAGYAGGGIREYDILPYKRQTKSGPERPSFVPLLKVMDNVCELLKGCRQLHCLRITLRSIEKTPGSIEKVLHPLRQLRGVKKTSAVCMGMQDDMWVDWNLKGSYGRYLNKILGMPVGAKAPRYIGDEKEPNQSDKEIFDMIGARWCGGKIFAYPDSDEDEDDDIDDDDLEFIDDEDIEIGDFHEFMEFMAAQGPGMVIPPTVGMAMAMGFGPPPGPWVFEDEDEDDETDETDEDDEEDEDDFDVEDEESFGPFPGETAPGQFHGFVEEGHQELYDQMIVEDVD